jgi:hypothetical protein
VQKVFCLSATYAGSINSKQEAPLRSRRGSERLARPRNTASADTNRLRAASQRWEDISVLSRFAPVLVIASLVFAQSDARQAEPQDAVGTNVHDPQIDYADSLSDYFRYSPRAVQLIMKKGIPAEEVAAVLHVAKYSRLTANDVIYARNEGIKYEDLARKNNVKFEGSNLLEHANLEFLSKYHARPLEEIKKMRANGASFVEINQELRREGATAGKN